MLYDFQSIREVYNQAIHLISSYYPLKSIGSNWIDFERKYGDFKSLLFVENLYLTKLKSLESLKLNEENSKETSLQNTKQLSNEVKNHQSKLIENKKSKGERNSKDDEKRNQYSGEKRKRNEEQEDIQTIKTSNDHSNKKLKLDGPGNENLTLFILNLSYSVTDEYLQELFEGIGCNIKRITIIKGKKGIPKGYGYIEMNDIESVKKGLEFDKKEVQGRVLIVEISNKPSPSSSGEKVEKKFKSEKNKSFGGERKKKKSLFGTSVISKDDDKNEKKEPLSNSDFKKFLQ